MKIIDTHSHYNLHQFDGDRDEAILRMDHASVGTICVGIDLPSSKLATEIAEANKHIWACVGQHPTEWELPWEEEKMMELAQKEKIVAIGECGIDYFREKDREGKERQKDLFLEQIRLAHKLDLPLMLHIRPQEGTMTAYEEALIMLEEYKKNWPGMRGTSHFFAGTKEIATRFLMLGFHISFSGVITFAKEYEELVRHVPIERILPETDAPFAAPAPYRGKKNEPAYVVEVVKKIAEIKQLPVEAVEKKLLENTKLLFRCN